MIPSCCIIQNLLYNLYKIDGQALKRIQDLETNKLDMGTTGLADTSPLSQTLLQMQVAGAFLIICRAQSVQIEHLLLIFKAWPIC